MSLDSHEGQFRVNFSLATKDLVASVRQTQRFIVVFPRTRIVMGARKEISAGPKSAGFTLGGVSLVSNGGGDYSIDVKESKEVISGAYNNDVMEKSLRIYPAVVKMKLTNEKDAVSVNLKYSKCFDVASSVAVGAGVSVCLPLSIKKLSSGGSLVDVVPRASSVKAVWGEQIAYERVQIPAGNSHVWLLYGHNGITLKPKAGAGAAGMNLLPSGSYAGSFDVTLYFND